MCGCVSCVADLPQLVCKQRPPMGEPLYRALPMACRGWGKSLHLLRRPLIRRQRSEPLKLLKELMPL